MLAIFALQATAQPATQPTTKPATKPTPKPTLGPVCVDSTGLALKGIDVTSYFDATRPTAQPTPGHPEFATRHEGATYHFATEETKARFLANPAHYLPQYGGYCAAGMASGYKAPTDPAAWTIVSGKLYLNYSPKVVTLWKPNAQENIAKADSNWAKVK
jgi:YHS domain-containing protein